MSVWLAAGFALLLAAAFCYWLFVLTEGVYLGQRVVTGLYDRFAPRYDGIKQYDVEDEAYFLGRPVARFLASRRDRIPGPVHVLDVACGTGRFSLAVLRSAEQPCAVTALDASANMLDQARRKLEAAGWLSQVTLVQHLAAPLPFADASFAVAGCLEALEFVPNRQAAVQELLRVLEPGGLLLLTNRIGGSARWLPGRIVDGDALAEELRAAGAGAVQRTPWQMDYDLILAVKQAPPGAQA